MRPNHQAKIITLWGVFLLGTLFHTQLGLMPLFHNQSVALSDVHGTENLTWILWGMLGFFAVPMIAMIVTLFDDSRRYRTIHFGVTALYSVMDLFHLVADLLVKPIFGYQIALMGMLLCVGLLLNIVAWQWVQERTTGKRLQSYDHSVD